VVLVVVVVLLLLLKSAAARLWSSSESSSSRPRCRRAATRPTGTCLAPLDCEGAGCALQLRELLEILLQPLQKVGHQNLCGRQAGR
jgi:hypothetical protein